MMKYTAEQRKKALNMLEEYGPHKTKEMTGIPATTLYRWKRMLEDNEPPVHVATDAPIEMDSDEEEKLEHIAIPDPDEKPEDDMNTVNEKLIQSLLSEIENLEFDNAKLKRENDQFRRMFVILLER